MIVCPLLKPLSAFGASYSDRHSVDCVDYSAIIEFSSMYFPESFDNIILVDPFEFSRRLLFAARAPLSAQVVVWCLLKSLSTSDASYDHGKSGKNVLYPTVVV